MRNLQVRNIHNDCIFVFERLYVYPDYRFLGTYVSNAGQAVIFGKIIDSMVHESFAEASAAKWGDSRSPYPGNVANPSYDVLPLARMLDEQLKKGLEQTVKTSGDRKE